MAKLGGLKKFETKHVATDIEGIFVRQLTMSEMKEKFGNVEEELEKDAEGTITRFFVELICDEEGQNFEDCQTWESIEQTLSSAAIWEIVGQVVEALNPTKKKS